MWLYIFTLPYFNSTTAGARCELLRHLCCYATCAVTYLMVSRHANRIDLSHRCVRSLVLRHSCLWRGLCTYATCYSFFYTGTFSIIVNFPTALEPKLLDELLLDSKSNWIKKLSIQYDYYTLNSTIQNKFIQTKNQAKCLK